MVKQEQFLNCLAVYKLYYGITGSITPMDIGQWYFVVWCNNAGKQSRKDFLMYKHVLMC